MAFFDIISFWIFKYTNKDFILIREKQKVIFFPSFRNTIEPVLHPPRDESFKSSMASLHYQRHQRHKELNETKQPPTISLCKSVGNSPIRIKNLNKFFLE